MATTDTAQTPRVARQPSATSHQGSGIGAGERAVSLINGSFLVFWGLITTLPLLWAILSAFKTNAEFSQSPWGLPASLQWDNFARAWSTANIGQYFLNSVIVVTISVTLTMLFGAMGAYAMARYDFRGSRVIYYGFVGGLIFPIFLALVPLYFIVQNLESLPFVGQLFGLNSYLSLALAYVGFSMPFTVFFLTAFFRTLPNTVAEAGIMDGCSHFTLFFRVMMPMAKPGLISIALFNFLFHWNSYILAVTLMTDDSKKVLAQGLAALAITQGYRGDWTALFAGLVIALLPILLVYIVFQKKVQAGLTAGMLK